jgi:hypothetical protein
MQFNCDILRVLFYVATVFLLDVDVLYIPLKQCANEERTIPSLYRGSEIQYIL